MLVNDKPPLDGALLMHYGIRGMKWGIRKGKSVTGISRRRGAVLDKNARQIRDFKELREGLKRDTGTRTTQTLNFLNRITMGRRATQMYYDQTIKSLEAQSSRIGSGKLLVRDRLTSALQSPVSLIVSIKPK